MKFYKKALAGAVLLAGASSVFADTAELKVLGTLSPGACVVGLAAGGLVDFGNVPSDSYGHVGNRVMDYTIDCAMPVAIGLELTDGRANGWNNSSSGKFFGLSDRTSAGARHGFRIAPEPAFSTADGAPVGVLLSTDSGSTWAPKTANFMYIDGNMMSYSAVGGVAPAAYQSYAGRMQIWPYIEGPGPAGTVDAVNWDGMAIMSVKYL